MIKKISIAVFIFLLPTIIFGNVKVFAVTTTPSAKAKTTPTVPPKTTLTPTPSAAATPESQEIDRIQKIKELVASRVAELNLVEKRGILGKVKETSTMQIIVEDQKGNTRNVDIDELTKFQKQGDEKSFGISDIKKEDNLSIIGLYNKDTKRLLARFISKAGSIPQHIEGIVIDKDIKEFTLKIMDEKGNTKTVDVQSSTKTSFHDPETKTSKSGFSKIEIDERILVVGFLDLKNKDIINASRVIHFKSPPASSKMRAYKETFGSDEENASTGSGLKHESPKQ